MKPITEQQRLETYRNSPEDIREVFTSDTLVEDIEKLMLLFEITVSYKEVSEIIYDTILGFYKIADMPKLFQQKLGVSADVSQRMTSQLIEFLSPVVKREEEAQANTGIGTPSISESKEELQDHPIAVIEPLRTMEGDITRIHGYGAYVQQKQERTEEGTTISSSQDDLLNRK